MDQSSGADSGVQPRRGGEGGDFLGKKLFHELGTNLKKKDTNSRKKVTKLKKKEQNSRKNGKTQEKGTKLKE